MPIRSRLGFVSSLNRPGGNATGVYFFIAAMEAKRLELLRDLVPTAALIGVLFNPNNATPETQSKEIAGGARAIGQQIQIVHAGTEAATSTRPSRRLAQAAPTRLLVDADPFFNSRRNPLVLQAAATASRQCMNSASSCQAGGLMSYGTSLTDAYRQVGIYTGRILKGAKPADLPVVQPTKFEFVINLKTAKALGLEVPPTSARPRRRGD